MTKKYTKKRKINKKNKTFKRGGFNWKFWEKKPINNEEIDLEERKAIDITEPEFIQDMTGYKQLETEEDNEMKKEEIINKQIAKTQSMRQRQQLKQDYGVEDPKELWNEDLQYYRPNKLTKTSKRVMFSPKSKMYDTEKNIVNLVDTKKGGKKKKYKRKNKKSKKLKTKN